MGREIRKVPPNWEHPTEHREYLIPGTRLSFTRELKYIPILDQTYEDAVAAWEKEKATWEAERPSYAGPQDTFEDHEGEHPEPSSYRTYKDEDATWFQVYETVSEGTPVSPPFATLKELSEYLALNGDYWDQERAASGKQAKAAWGHAAAEAFCRSGYSPSMIIVGGNLITNAGEMALEFEERKNNVQGN